MPVVVVVDQFNLDPVVLVDPVVLEAVELAVVQILADQEQPIQDQAVVVLVQQVEMVLQTEQVVLVEAVL
jgi:hypothetical protein